MPKLMNEDKQGNQQQENHRRKNDIEEIENKSPFCRNGLIPSLYGDCPEWRRLTSLQYAHLQYSAHKCRLA